jgi:hypothetical protein
MLQVKRVGHGFSNVGNYRLPAAPLRGDMASPPDRETATPLSTLGGIEPVHDNAPSADQIVGRGQPRRVQMTSAS